MSAEIRLIGLDGIPEARADDRVSDLVVRGLEHDGLAPADGDIVVVANHPEQPAATPARRKLKRA